MKAHRVTHGGEHAVQQGWFSSYRATTTRQGPARAPGLGAAASADVV